MSQPRRTSYAPWITAAVAGAALLALLLVYFVALRPDEDDIVGGFTDRERDAMRAASLEAQNSLSFRRASFEADYQRALSGATGAFASDLKNTKDAAKKALTDGKYDLSAKVTNVALEEPIDSGGHHGYVVLVTLNGYQSTAPDLPKLSQLAVTVEDVNGKWLVSDVESIGVSS
jgi:nitrogen fixation protein